MELSGVVSVLEEEVDREGSFLPVPIKEDNIPEGNKESSKLVARSVFIIRKAKKRRIILSIMGNESNRLTGCASAFIGSIRLVNMTEGSVVNSPHSTLR